MNEDRSNFDVATVAYRRMIRWSNGLETRQGFLERHQLLIENGAPTHLFCATAEGPGSISKTPLEQSTSSFR